MYDRSTATVVAYAGTAADLADALRSSNQADPKFIEALVRKITPAKAVQVIRTTGATRKLMSEGRSVIDDSLRGRAVGTWGNTAAEVFVKVTGTIAGGPGGFTSGEVQPVSIFRAMGQFSILRLFVESDPNARNETARIKMVNASAFMGYPAYTVQYMGPQREWCFDVPGGHLLAMSYRFRTDDQMFVDDSKLPIGRVYINPLTPLLGSGFYAATLFGATHLLSWPDSTDFSVFLNP